ncbi:protein lifeguard 3-like isoform X2 [Ostrea edulis]|uniref:protein lifeguard 3-like isoform X2 n=1 Tax=Ostrea edulis TaxID=37623 RepID=UPI00209601FE|nr:protein lifeguard 3-like isoform X2 [Ostrea edulis]
MSRPSVPPPSYNQSMAYPDSANTQYPPQSEYPLQKDGYPPQTGGYPPQTGGYPPQTGGYDQPSSYGYGAPLEPQEQIEPVFIGGSFSDKAIRRGFIRKVYLVLMAQLLVTFAFAILFSTVKPVKVWMRTTGVWFYYAGYAVFIVTYIVLACIPSVRRKSPGNFICLGIFTIALSWMVGTISSFYETNSVLVAAGITAAVCLSISLFAIQTKIDFTMCSGFLFALVMVLFFFGWSCLIVYFTIGYSYILDCVWGGLAALVFSLIPFVPLNFWCMIHRW